MMLILSLVLGYISGNAQKGVAPVGYYPANYSGDTFTGTVTDTQERQITLEYRGKSKTESFVGVTNEPCMASVKTQPRTAKELHLNAIPKGSNLTVLYSRKKVKRADGSKEDTNVVIGFWFNELNGEKLSNAPVIPCFTGAGYFTGYKSQSTEPIESVPHR